MIQTTIQFHPSTMMVMLPLVMFSMLKFVYLQNKQNTSAQQVINSFTSLTQSTKIIGIIIVILIQELLA